MLLRLTPYDPLIVRFPRLRYSLVVVEIEGVVRSRPDRRILGIPELFPETYSAFLTEFQARNALDALITVLRWHQQA